MTKFTFKAHKHGDRWVPMGTNKNDDEVWCDGCCIDDKQLADRIAANMKAAYEQGLTDAARAMVQQAIKIAEVGDGSISDMFHYSGGWVVNKK